MLVLAVRLLRPLLEDLVFVGGSVTGLLITDTGAPDIRATFDVDAIAEITSYHDYVKFGEQLQGLGFTPDTREDAPLCRWKNGDVTLDLMPLDEKILGFSNRWYKDALEKADTLTIEPTLRIRCISAPLFVATKLEAFKSRGARDFSASRDLEDVLALVDGRAELIGEVRASSRELRRYLAHEFKLLLNNSHFIDALPGHLPPDAASQARIPIILRRLAELT
jgi:predicted nucleotidyltransferase